MPFHGGIECGGFWRRCQQLWVSATVDDVVLAEVHYSLSAERLLAPVAPAALPPRAAPYTVTCRAARTRGGPAVATYTSTYHVLPPNPYNGSTVLLDTLSGALLVRDAPAHFPGTPVAGGDGRTSSFFPVGYYTAWGGHLEANFSLLAGIKAAGFTLVHPVPGGGGADAAWGSLARFAAFMDAAAAAGLWVMYDLRHTFASAPDVAAQAALLRAHPALLLWYTADEPDGHNVAPGAVAAAYAQLQALDGYHPVAAAPNCENYFFSAYAAGADIVAPDVYPVGIGARVSRVYGTPCNRTYGCCGCDNCDGAPTALADRIAAMRALARIARIHKVFWGVVQAFGNSEFWSREPTGAEVVAMSEGAVEAGARGLLYWSAPTSDEIWEASSRVAKKLNSRPVARGDREL